MDRKNRRLIFRELAGFFLLAALLLLGLLSAWRLNRQYTAMARDMEEGTWLALSGQWENARETAAAVRTQWEQGWQVRAVFADHSPMEEINALFQELTVCGAAGERTDFSRICAQLAEKLKAMAAASSPGWWNVL